MNSLALLCYQSDALLARPQDLDAIAEAASRHNAANDVTGCLFHEGGHYYHIVEGPIRQLFALMLRLEKDRRHRCILITAIAPLERRSFASYPLAVLSDSETQRLMAACDSITRQQRRYIEPDSRVAVIEKIADILKNRRHGAQQARLRA